MSVSVLSRYFLNKVAQEPGAPTRKKRRRIVPSAISKVEPDPVEKMTFQKGVGTFDMDDLNFFAPLSDLERNLNMPRKLVPVFNPEHTRPIDRIRENNEELAEKGYIDIPDEDAEPSWYLGEEPSEEDLIFSQGLDRIRELETQINDMVNFVRTHIISRIYKSEPIARDDYEKRRARGEGVELISFTFPKTPYNDSFDAWMSVHINRGAEVKEALRDIHKMKANYNNIVNSFHSKFDREREGLRNDRLKELTKSLGD